MRDSQPRPFFISLACQCLLLRGAIDERKGVKRHEWPHYIDLKKFSLQLGLCLVFKARLYRDLGQQQVCLFRNVSKRTLDKLPLAGDLHLLGDHSCHLVDIINSLAAVARSQLDLVLLQEHLQSDVLHSLRVQALNLRDEVLLSSLNFLEKLNFILLNCELGLLEHVAHGG